VITTAQAEAVPETAAPNNDDGRLLAEIAANQTMIARARSTETFTHGAEIRATS